MWINSTLSHIDCSLEKVWLVTFQKDKINKILGENDFKTIEKMQQDNFTWQDFIDFNDVKCLI